MPEHQESVETPVRQLTEELRLLRETSVSTSEFHRKADQIVEALSRLRDSKPPSSPAKSTVAPAVASALLALPGLALTLYLTWTIQQNDLAARARGQASPAIGGQQFSGPTARVQWIHSLVRTVRGADKPETVNVLATYLHEVAPWAGSTSLDRRRAGNDIELAVRAIGDLRESKPPSADPSQLTFPQVLAIARDPSALFQPEQGNQALDRINLTRLDLSARSLPGVNLSFTNLWASHFEGANLWQARFQGAFLNEANFRGADLRNADLRGASLWDAHFEGANLFGAQVTEKQIAAAIIDQETVLPNGMRGKP